MKRTGRLKRGSWKRRPSDLWTAADGLPVSKGIRASAKRKADVEAEDEARKWGSLERIFIVKSLSCIVPFCGRSPCENAHGDEGKEGAHKAGYLTINPLCAEHHRLHLHAYHGSRGGSERAFEEHWLIPNGLTWADCARQTEELVQANGAQIIYFAKLSGAWDEFVRSAA